VAIVLHRGTMRGELQFVLPPSELGFFITVCEIPWNALPS